MLRREGAFLDLLPIGISVIDLQGTILYCNKHYAVISEEQQDNLIGKSVLDHYAENGESKKIIEENLEKKTQREYNVYETTITLKSGKKQRRKITPIALKDEEGRIYGSLAIIEDITKDQMLFQAQKHEVVAQIARALAHNINNLLMIFYNYLPKISQRLDGEELKYADDMQKALDGVKQLASDLLAYAKPDKVEYAPFSPNNMIDQSFNLLRAPLKNAKLEKKLEENIGLVNGSPIQIQQVIYSMLENADQHRASSIIIETTNKTIYEDDALPLNPGEYICITVQDDGEGIKREDYDKIFDPFFTTREQGSGTGLAIAFSIIKSHGGFILFESETSQKDPDHGTSFHIYLPVHK